MIVLFIIIYYIRHALSSDPNCARGILDEIYGICATRHCPLRCDDPSYCHSNTSIHMHCCCDGVIQSSGSCDSNSPPCLYEPKDRDLNSMNISDYLVFGLEITHESISTADHTTPKLLTLFWDSYQYECVVYTPDALSESFFFCDTSSTDTKACPTVLSPATVPYGLQIDYAGDTPLLVDQIIVKQITNNRVSNLYIISNFASNTTKDSGTHHNISVQNDHNLVIFDGINTTQPFSMDIEGNTVHQPMDSACARASFSQQIPENINSSLLAEEICVFGAHHAFLDGTYEFIAWDLVSNGPMYYDDNEHKYLYPVTTGDYFQWQIHEDYSSESSYSYCDMKKTDEDRYYIQYCDMWKTDLNLLDDFQDTSDYETDEFVSVTPCDHDAMDESVTFEIEILSWDGHRPGALSLTLYWNETKYKCTIYPTKADLDYSCNTKLSAIQCRSKHDNPVEYGLQIDVFSEDADHTLAEDLQLNCIIIRNMKGNVVQEVHKMQHFCVEEECDEGDEVLYVSNHTLVTFTYRSTDTYYDVDALDAHVEHTQSLSECIPEQSDGYSIWLNKYVLVQQNMSWMDAADYCKEEYNTSLATIKSEHDLLRALTLRELNNSNHDVWIGLNNVDENGWEWVDDVDDDDDWLKQHGWAYEKPDDDRFQLCAEMSGVNAMGQFNNDDCDKHNVFLCRNLISEIIPDWVGNISKKICVFGSRHAYLDGTYHFIAWNELIDGPIYYDENEHKYLYPAQDDDDEYQWQIHENYHSNVFYSFCEIEEGTSRYDVSNCTYWEVDITGKGTTLSEDTFVTVRPCDEPGESDQNSTTFEIETDWAWDGDAITLTLYWEGDTYECTVYSDNDDQDYSCNTLLGSARKCDARWTDNPVKYGLQIDFFGDVDDGDDPFYLKSITIKYMTGNVVRDAHVMEHFCDHDQECTDELHVFNHTLVNFTYFHSNETYSDTDALHAHIEHSKSLAPCVPNGYNIDKRKEEPRYILVQDEMNWENAKAYCETEYGASLATIGDKDDLLDALALREMNRSNEDMWIGLHADTLRYLTWEWVDGTPCFEGAGTCIHDPRWAKTPVYDRSGDEICAEMHGAHANGHFLQVDCDDEHIFLCNVPTPDPTAAPTFTPTPSPTHNVDPHDIAIIMHSNVSEDNPHWISFALDNVDLSCDGYIDYVKISDKFPYKWVNYTTNASGYYTFVLENAFDPPIDVQIARRYPGGTEILNQSSVIEEFTGGEHFDYRTNFCMTTGAPGEIENFLAMYIVMGAIIFVFFVILVSGTIDANYCRKNDHFIWTAFVSSCFQLLDMVSDIFFCHEVWTTYVATKDEQHSLHHRQTIFFAITALSMTFIILPVLISIYQLHKAANRDWIKNNRIGEWLKRYTPLLYVVSIITGSSFNAIQIFNSNLYGLHIFYMALPRQNILKFSTKKLYSIILFENIPQLLLSAWYMYALMSWNYISVTQMFFSVMSIIVTVITIITQSNIDKTQDQLLIHIEVKGQGVLDHRKECRNHVKWLSKYLAREVLGVDYRWVQVQKPYAGSVLNGLKLEIYITFNHARGKAVELEDKYNKSLRKVIDDRTMRKRMKREWGLNPDEELKMGRFGCKFVSQERRESSAALAESLDMLVPKVSLQEGGLGESGSGSCFYNDDDDDDEKRQLTSYAIAGATVTQKSRRMPEGEYMEVRTVEIPPMAFERDVSRSCS